MYSVPGGRAVSFGNVAAQPTQRAGRAVDRVADVKPIYAATRVLLVPSKWSEETWGRVASEAQFSGIPILATDVGGLPEAIGPGGLILPHNAPPETWAIALRQLWNDSDQYGRLSKLALSHSQRDAIVSPTAPRSPAR
jgi:glycosyltransferase involved in cell wall biosynthesis